MLPSGASRSGVDVQAAEVEQRVRQILEEDATTAQEIAEQLERAHEVLNEALKDKDA